MVQRSPGYFLKLPGVEPLNAFIRKWFPSSISHRLIRFRVLIQSFMFFYYCRLFPKQATRLLHSNTEK
jgi:monooxygenase